MRVLFHLVVFAAAISPVTAQSYSPANTDRAHDRNVFTLPSVVEIEVEGANNAWEMSGKSYQIASPNITYRVSGEKITSVYGAFIMSCGEGRRKIPVNMVLSGNSELAVSQRKTLNDKGYTLLDMKHVIMIVSSNLSIDKSLHDLVISLLADSCEQHQKDAVQNIAISIWSGKRGSILQSVPVGAARVDQIR